MIRQLRFDASVLLLLLPLDYKAVSLLAVRGVLQVSLLVSGVTPKKLLDVFHDTGVGVFFLGVVPCPGLDPWYPLPWLPEPPPQGR